MLIPFIFTCGSPCFEADTSLIPYQATPASRDIKCVGVGRLAMIWSVVLVALPTSFTIRPARAPTHVYIQLRDMVRLAPAGAPVVEKLVFMGT